MFKLEIHASEGGKDSEIFASQLSEAISKYTGLTRSNTGRVVTLSGRL